MDNSTAQTAGSFVSAMSYLLLLLVLMRVFGWLFLHFFASEADTNYSTAPPSSADEKAIAIVNEYSQRYDKALVVATPPQIPNLDKVKGILAMRQWRYSEGKIISTFQNTVWKPVMFADSAPSNKNESGLYALQLNRHALVKHLNNRIEMICGLVEIRGHIEYHDSEDGIRGEWAKIICLFIARDDWSWGYYNALPKLQANYPTVPIYVLTEDALCRCLTDMVLWQESRNKIIEKEAILA